MKTLVLIRHAKSSWKAPQPRDHQRPLNKRGERNRWQMADYLARHPIPVQRLYSSSALRARLTAEAIGPSLGAPPQLSSRLYTFAAGDLLNQVRGLAPTLASVALAGHNPALTELANWLDPTPLANLPTCAVLILRLECDNWAHIHHQCGHREALFLAREL